MAEEYGPNTHEVVRFLSRLSHLSREEWSQVGNEWGQVDATALRTWPKPTWAGAWVSAEDAAGRANLQEVVSRVARAAGEAATAAGGSPDATSMAAMALVVRHLIPRSVFETLYAPFSYLIPVSLLEGGPA